MLAFELTEGGWLDALPASQKRIVQTLLANGKSEEQIAEQWLSQFGSTSTAGFGGGEVIESFYANVKREFVAFICGDPKYDEERTQVAAIWKDQGKVGLVSMVAALVATTVNLAAAAIIPVIALLFSLVAKIGLNAFCGACGTKA